MCSGARNGPGRRPRGPGPAPASWPGRSGSSWSDGEVDRARGLRSPTRRGCDEPSPHGARSAAATTSAAHAIAATPPCHGSKGSSQALSDRGAGSPAGVPWHAPAPAPSGGTTGPRGMVNHETTPPSGQQPGADQQRLAVGVCRRRPGSSYCVAGQADGHGQRGHREQRPGPRDGVVHAAGDAGPVSSGAAASTVAVNGATMQRQARARRRTSGGSTLGPVRRAVVDAGQPGDADGHHQRPDRHRDARPDPGRRALHPGRPAAA